MVPAEASPPNTPGGVLHWDHTGHSKEDAVGGALPSTVAVASGVHFLSDECAPSVSR